MYLCLNFIKNYWKEKSLLCLIVTAEFPPLPNHVHALSDDWWKFCSSDKMEPCMHITSRVKGAKIWNLL